ncbi:MAG: hypothetical protein EWV72_15860 [Microcystis flos-aquae Mf_QC_C_20070823_S10]|nr:MAG: hypothetical protein EWV72_15860 [Microcystis flos-aquae Mf_QC_C_20070823_S10]
MSDAPLIKGGLKGGLRGDRHPPYQGGQGGSNLKSIFNLIITSYISKNRKPTHSDLGLCGLIVHLILRLKAYTLAKSKSLTQSNTRAIISL